MSRRVYIPKAPNEYDGQEQNRARRSMEIEIQQLSNDLQRIELQKSKQGTLALRRHQFLLMGA